MADEALVLAVAAISVAAPIVAFAQQLTPNATSRKTLIYRAGKREYDPAQRQREIPRDIHQSAREVA